jgi:putative endonuclease
MWDVYILQSLKFDKYYIGYSQDAYYRLKNYHNIGKCKSTKAYKPYRLVGLEKYNTKTEAIKRENELKRMKKGNQFKNLFK